MCKNLKNIELKILNPKLIDLLKITSDSIGLDVRVVSEDNLTIYPGETKLINTGFAYHLNDSKLMAILIPKSILHNRFGIVVENNINIMNNLDEVKISCWNRSTDPYTFKPFERIAQMVFVPVVQVEFNVISEFSDDSENERQGGGFGHTGRI